MVGCWLGGSGGRYCDRKVVLCAGRFNAGKASGTGRVRRAAVSGPDVTASAAAAWRGSARIVLL